MQTELTLSQADQATKPTPRTRMEAWMSEVPQKILSTIVVAPANVSHVVAVIYDQAAITVIQQPTTL